MSDEFISQPIEPVRGTFDTRRMAAGEPGVPGEFRWGGQTYAVTKTLRTWKTTKPCTHGSGEKYVRRHYYEVAVNSGETMVLYFDRQPFKRGKPKEPRWWLLSKNAR